MKQVVASFVKFLVYSNLFIAACALALAAETFFLLRLPASAAWYLPLLFCCTLFVYCLHYYVKTGKAGNDSRLQWCRSHKLMLRRLIILSAVLVAAIVLYHFRQVFYTTGKINYINIGWFITVPLMALAYSHRLFPWTKKALRQVGWLKMALLSFTWAFTTTLLPVLMLAPGQWQQLPWQQLAALFIHRFLFMAPLSVLFNVNDQEEDKADGVQTIAVVIGPAKTLRYGKWVALITSLVSSFLVLRVFGLYQPVFYLALLAPCLLLFLAFHRFRPATEEAFFVLRYDGLMIIKALLLIFALLSFTV